MNKYFIALLLFICIGCEKDNYKKTEFFLKNSCNYSIEVKSSALVRYSDGYKEESLTDIVQNGQLLSMRKLDVSEDFTIKDVFTKIEIYKGTTKSTYDVMNMDNWVKTLTSDDKDEYTITVDSTFFK
jgi:hypothetical protein